VKRSAHLGFALLISLTASPVFARATPMTLHTAASEPFTAYVDGPKDAERSMRPRTTRPEGCWKRCTTILQDERSTQLSSP
jgi:hypothetical protein